MLAIRARARARAGVAVCDAPATAAGAGIVRGVGGRVSDPPGGNGSGSCLVSLFPPSLGMVLVGLGIGNWVWVLVFVFGWLGRAGGRRGRMEGWTHRPGAMSGCGWKWGQGMSGNGARDGIWDGGRVALGEWPDVG